MAWMHFDLLHSSNCHRHHFPFHHSLLPCVL
jgi:hypothetical protein